MRIYLDRFGDILRRSKQGDHPDPYAGCSKSFWEDVIGFDPTMKAVGGRFDTFVAHACHPAAFNDDLDPKLMRATRVNTNVASHVGNSRDCHYRFEEYD